MMKHMTAVAAMLLATTATANAQSIVDNFDNEAPGTTQTPYSGFAQFDVTAGSVDLLFQPNSFGLTCAGGSGSCVDLDGSTGAAGTLTTKNALAFTAGQQVTLTFDLSGNQRGAGADTFDAGFSFGSPAISLADFTIGGGYGTFNFGAFGPTSGISLGSSIADTAPFSTYSITFRALSAGSAKAFIGTTGTDNQGPILDNFSFSVAAVPEPASWALMIVGIGAVGGTLRRRATRTTVRFA